MEEKRLTKKERKALAKEEKHRAWEREVLYGKMKKLLIAAFGVFIIGFFSYKVWNYFSSPQPDAAGVTIQVLDDDWIKGDPDAQVTLIEYSDFQCPACRNYFEIVNKLHEDFPKDLRIVYKHFPLESIHPDARSAAKAAEAAGKQDKFWEMHDKLFEKQGEWSEDNSPEDKFRDYAEELGLDLGKFDQDYQSSEVEDRVNRDLVNANQLRLNQTPTFFLNGKEIQPQSYDEFKKLVETQVHGYTIEE